MSLNNLDVIFVDVDDFYQTFLPCMGGTPNFFRCQTKTSFFAS
ncbi:hypothetical protein [Candidatus Enterovibrio escicola]|nr:hypothetical protein [Candidatus Enterovibrio escacola]